MRSTRSNKFIRILVAALLICVLVCAPGCKNELPVPTGTLPLPTTGPKPTETVPPTTEVSAGDASLVSLRQVLVETPQLFAVAYFGYQEIIDQDMQADPFKIMQKNAYWLSKDLPFLMDIPQDRIVGETGELYCIVPRDENATVAVNRGIWDDDGGQQLYENVIYRSESGEPILLFCNGSGWERIQKW